ncbi:alpha/beta hydrolase [Pelomonas sp. HMWF004]|nr:alpha/beta hydrolase [Pelomonas sp. HMWF004]
MKLACGVVFLASCLVSQAAQSAETFLEAPGPHGPLKATLLAPDAGSGRKAPAVLIIPGSGPTDRDGNNPLGVKAAAYRLLAEALAQRGLSTVRIDKRGMFASAAAIPDGNNVTINDYATDVHAWVNVIKAKTGAPCVWALGHSEGGLVALAAAQNPEGLCGLILVSTAGRALGEVLRGQLRANPANAPLLADADSAISKLERGGHVDVSSMHPALQGLFAPAVQGFLISNMSLDPAALLKAYRGPVLIIQGDKDLQVGVEDAQRLGQANASAKVVVLPDVNHVLKAVSSSARSANLAAYADPGLPIAPGIADAIVDFVQSAARRP